MAVSVRSAFEQFRASQVDLPADQVTRARASRDYLMRQATDLGKVGITFPRTSGRYVYFGSFARKTKIRPLDDVDLMVVVNSAHVREELSVFTTNTSRLHLTDATSPLFRYANPDGTVNSIRVLNSMKSALSGLHFYRNSDLKRNMQAVNLNLVSYDWSFDVVPTVEVIGSAFDPKTLFYVIPNGGGEWMRTDPRVDAALASTVNQRHLGQFLPTLRLLKYWNGRTHKPRLKSFYFEVLALRIFESAPPLARVPEAVRYFFEQCQYRLLSPCPRPAGHGASLDTTVAWDTRQAVATAMMKASEQAGYALKYEGQGNMKDALYCWRQVFGSEFPPYG